MGVTPQDPKSCASASSATPAGGQGIHYTGDVSYMAMWWRRRRGRHQSTLDCRRNAAHNRGKGAKRWLCAALKCGAQSEKSSREPRTRAAQ
jgi:hypothetical protein